MPLSRTCRCRLFMRAFRSDLWSAVCGASCAMKLCHGWLIRGAVFAALAGGSASPEGVTPPRSSSQCPTGARSCSSVSQCMACASRSRSGWGEGAFIKPLSLQLARSHLPWSAATGVIWAMSLHARRKSSVYGNSGLACSKALGCKVGSCFIAPGVWPMRKKRAMRRLSAS